MPDIDSGSDRRFIRRFLARARLRLRIKAKNRSDKPETMFSLACLVVGARANKEPARRHLGLASACCGYVVDK
ncbi:hypothetical protein CUJ87_28710 [Paraburkholderia caledonica]|nr:hypothetical protein CUJ87_28710 [Paraburkholderia caledonica]